MAILLSENDRLTALLQAYRASGQADAEKEALYQALLPVMQRLARAIIRKLQYKTEAADIDKLADDAVKRVIIEKWSTGVLKNWDADRGACITTWLSLLVRNAAVDNWRDHQAYSAPLVYDPENQDDGRHVDADSQTDSFICWQIQRKVRCRVLVADVKAALSDKHARILAVYLQMEQPSDQKIADRLGVAKTTVQRLRSEVFDFILKHPSRNELRDLLSYRQSITGQMASIQADKTPAADDKYGWAWQPPPPAPCFSVAAAG
ncbi:MAG: hypothetical protein EPN21_03585 [Methylococcaceae bacterium]|nr:MAG: hypothetical protein EPN21_03585 [Methylococcaceae bacterium]